MNKYKPIKTYIPIYGYYYSVVYINELFKDKKNFMLSSIINAYTTIFSVGIIYNLVNIVWKVI